MQIKGIQTVVNGRVINVALPNKKSIIMKGSNAQQLIYIMECLLSNDFTGYNFNLDKNYGFYYSEVEGTSILEFSTGIIKGEDSTIFKVGKPPKIHCIRYLNNGQFRSFLCNEELSYGEVYATTQIYSSAISDSSWVRLCCMYNDLVGDEVVKLSDKKVLSFNWSEKSEFSVEAQKLMYMLLSECFLTPKGYLRVVLLPNISCLTGKQQVKFIEVLDNVTGHEMLISNGDIDFSDIPENSALTMINT